jgi:hypothetical protein
MKFVASLILVAGFRSDAGQIGFERITAVLGEPAAGAISP